MNDRTLKEYMEYLPEEMLYGAAKLASPPSTAPDSASQNGSQPGFFKRLTGSAAFRYSAASILIVVSLAAGIILAIKLGQREKRNDKTVISGETGVPEATAVVTPTDVPAVTETATAPASTETPTVTSEPEVPTATTAPGPEAGPEFYVPVDAVQYDVVIDTAKAIIYPVYIPDNIKLSSGGNESKGYFNVRYEQLIPLVDSDDPASKYDGTFYVNEVYLCDAVKTENTITLSARSIYMWLEYTSQEALYDLLFTLNRKDPNPQSDGVKGLYALLNGVTYEIGSGTFKSALFTPVAVKELTLNNRSGNWFLTGHSGFNLSQPASSSTYSAIRISYTYDNSGSLSSIISVSSTENAENVQESYYENGVIARTVTTYASGMIDESIYGSDGCYAYHRRVEGNKETVRENYKNRDDLLAFVEKVTVSNGEYTVNYTEKQYYYKTRPDPDDYDSSGTYLAGDVYLYSYIIENSDAEGWSRTETIYYMSGGVHIIRESGSGTAYAPAEYVRYYDEEGNLLKEEEEYLSLSPET
ncbi:MAG: hypothetical protein J5950_03380 [Clostridia bacterium]|nr:hypothetical protein [Clostridia bacterium]